MVGEYKKSEMLRQAVEQEAKGLREMLRYVFIVSDLSYLHSLACFALQIKRSGSCTSSRPYEIDESPAFSRCDFDDEE